MIRLVINIIVLVILAVFISINIQYSTTVNLFGHKLEQIPTIAVILISISAGVIYSFFYYIMSYLAKNRKNRIKTQGRKTKEKEKELKNKEKNIKKHIEKEAKKAVPQDEDAESTGNTDTAGGKSIFDRIKNRK